MLKLSYRQAATYEDESPEYGDFTIKGPNLPESVKWPDRDIGSAQYLNRTWALTCPNCKGEGCRKCNYEGVIESQNNPQVHGEGYEEPYDVYNEEYIQNEENRPWKEGLTTDYWDFGPRRFGAKTPLLDVGGKSWEWDSAKEEWVLRSVNDWEIGSTQPTESLDEDRHHQIQISDEKPGIMTINA